MRIRSRSRRGGLRVAALAALALLVAAGCAGSRARDARADACPAGGEPCPRSAPRGPRALHGEPGRQCTEGMQGVRCIKGVHAMHHGFASDVETVQVISALVGGKNVFVPSTIVVTDAGPRTLSLLNTTEMPHGFSIAALGIELVLAPGKETLLPLPPLAGGQVLRVHCQMHPAHRMATLVVLPGRPPGPLAPPPSAPEPPPAGHTH